jgi:hypothetical protein
MRQHDFDGAMYFEGLSLDGEFAGVLVRFFSDAEFPFLPSPCWNIGSLRIASHNVTIDREHHNNVTAASQTLSVHQWIDAALYVNITPFAE